MICQKKKKSFSIIKEEHEYHSLFILVNKKGQLMSTLILMFVNSTSTDGGSMQECPPSDFFQKTKFYIYIYIYPNNTKKIKIKNKTQIISCKQKLAQK